MGQLFSDTILYQLNTFHAKHRGDMKSMNFHGCNSLINRNFKILQLFNFTN